MELQSLAYRTDLALLRLGGSEVVDRGTHLVVRTVENPGFYWGNYLLLPRAPVAGEAEAWVAEFRREFPGARHRTFGVDGSDGSLDDLAPFAALGFETEASTVMTARSVHEPARPNREATYRPLRGDDDWRQQLELSLAGEDEHATREFAARRARAQRAVTEAGHGQWFGAFLGDRLVSTMGLVRADGGLARFQEVKTHPVARGRGLAGTLVHHASRFGFDELGAETLVMVADPDYLAIRIYRQVGFQDTETQLAAALAPPS
jgi:ribosomal protein S18 acetylase RimI-like enzyme